MPQSDIDRAYLYRDLAHTCYGSMSYPVARMAWHIIGFQPVNTVWLCGFMISVGFMGGWAFLKLSRTAVKRHFRKLRESGVSQVTKTGRF